MYLTQEEVTITVTITISGGPLYADISSYQVSVTVNGYIAVLCDCVRIKVTQAGNAGVVSNVTAVTNSYIKPSQVIFYKKQKGKILISHIIYDYRLNEIKILCSYHLEKLLSDTVLL